MRGRENTDMRNEEQANTSKKNHRQKSIVKKANVQKGAGNIQKLTGAFNHNSFRKWRALRLSPA